MTRQRLVGVCAWMAIGSAVLTAQQSPGASEQPPQAPSTTVSERRPSAGSLLPSRQVQTRRVAGDRENVVDTIETPGVGGRFEPLQEVVTETVTAGSTRQTTSDVFAVDMGRQRRLLERTQATQETLANGERRFVETTSQADVNGRLGVTSRVVEETRTVAPGARETTTTLLRPDVDGPLRENRRTQSTEREVGPGVVRVDSTESVRDPNGRWEVLEVRHRDTRAIGASESVEDETIQRQDVGGRLIVSERNVTRRTEANGRVVEVTETFGETVYRSTRPATRMGLSQRVTRTTTPTADGGRTTVEEVEARSLAAPNEPMRVVRRTLEAVRRAASGQLMTERQIFERDPNGRLVLVANETEGTTGQ